MCKNRIYLSKIDMSLSQDVYEGLLGLISEENREKCRRFKFKEDALRTLYGELMLRHVLVGQLALKNEEIEILKGKWGKPYVEGLPTHFNISHSGDYVVCAFSQQEVGVDIEQIQEVDLNIAKRYFTQREYEDLLAQTESQRLEYFFSLWTLKESYMKWSGRGMHMPLDSFSFEIAGGDISLVDVKLKEKLFFKQSSFEGYQISLCTTIESYPLDIETITIEDMSF
ncbi:MAG: 4'-phosphopantetheinyl transferase superfamily protein [Defluviitaleaceae bacterium]|nr:4'-phosphopantetheinyl transferase superfamily protein [Defluviitaleaceae bacterium]